MGKTLLSALVIIVCLPVIILAGCREKSQETTISTTTSSTTIKTTTDSTITTTSTAKDTGTYNGGTIRIQSDTQFTRANGVVSGSGTETDPYIIRGWTIDAAACATDIWPYIRVGIAISQTSRYFVITDCHIESNGQSEVGISLMADNGKVENCIVRGCNTGIGISGCSNLVITGNTISNYANAGLSNGSYSSSQITISNNSFTGGDGDGIEFHYLENSRADGNTINNSEYGIYVDSVFDCTVSGNTLSGNRQDGISVNSSFANTSATISDNKALANEYDGISVFCSNNVITGNTASSNAGIGIRLSNVALIADTTSNNLVSGNTAENNGRDGLHIEGPHNTISNNTCLTNNTLGEFYGDGSPRWYDLYVEYLQYNTLTGNVYGTVLLIEYRP